MFVCNNIIKEPEMTKYVNDKVVNEILKENLEIEFVSPVVDDRFIPRRLNSEDDNKLNKKFFRVNGDFIADILNWDLPKNYWLQNAMAENMKRVFQIREERILKFCEKKKFHDSNNFPFETSKKNNHKNEDWPCRPRRKPWAYAETTHDSFGFFNGYERNKMDWSINGQVVASYDDDVVIWKQIRDVSITFHVDSVSCLSYGPTGKYLALGCRIATFAAIELWDVNKYSIKVEIVNRFLFKEILFKVLCIEWSKDGDTLVCGTNSGKLLVFSIPQLKILRIIHDLKYPIFTLRFSPNMRYLAVVNIFGNISIFNWFHFEQCLRISCKSKFFVLIDWHPWNGDELIVAKRFPASIILVHVPSKEITASYRKKNDNIRIDSIAFNKITGELLLSISRQLQNSPIEHKIFVLSSLNCVVDELSTASGARFLMWDPNGTRLVTAGIDDSITIWSFYPKNKQKPKKFTTPLEKLFYGCKSGEQFKFWSTIR